VGPTTGNAEEGVVGRQDLGCTMKARRESVKHSGRRHTGDEVGGGKIENLAFDTMLGNGSSIVFQLAKLKAIYTM
jgi:hypothetical protein